MDQIKIGEFIASERRAHSMTQAELAEKLYISAKTVSRWETGKGMPEVSLMMPLCRELEISVNELLSGQRLTEESRESFAERNLLAVLREKARRKKVLGAVITAIVTIAVMIGLYGANYPVEGASTVKLGGEITAHHYSAAKEPVRTDVILTETLGRYLYALFNESGSGETGLAKFEKGVFGKYRFISANSSGWPLYRAELDRVSGENYLIIYALNDLPCVSSYKYFGNTEKTGEPIYEGTAERAPFIRFAELDADTGSLFPWASYYDGNGNEIDDMALAAEFTDEHSFSSRGSGLMERGLVYFFEAFILFIGIVFIRYFLGKTGRKREKAPDGAENIKQEADHEISDPGRADAGRDLRP